MQSGAVQVLAPSVPEMIPAYESTALLAVMAALVAERGVGVRLGMAADGLVAAVGALTYVEEVHLPAVAAAGWLAAAAVAGDQVARLAGQSPQRDPFGLLVRAHGAGTFALASLVSDVVWIAGLVVAGRVLAAVLLR